MPYVRSNQIVATYIKEMENLEVLLVFSGYGHFHPTFLGVQ